jgi:hypothetical protein
MNICDIVVWGFFCTFFLDFLMQSIASICRYVGDIPLDVNLLLRQVGPATPIVVLYRSERASAERLVEENAARRPHPLLRIHLSGTGHAEEKRARKLLTQARNQVLCAVLLSFPSLHTYPLSGII